MRDLRSSRKIPERKCDYLSSRQLNARVEQKLEIVRLILVSSNHGCNSLTCCFEFDPTADQENVTLIFEIFVGASLASWSLEHTTESTSGNRQRMPTETHS